MKMKVDTSRIQKASMAMVKEMRNWSRAVSVIESAKAARACSESGGTR